jgi:uncharacterized protein YndB with AHSA1/START domain
VSEQKRPAAQDRQVLRLERQLDHPVDRVWDALIDPAQLGRWYRFAVLDLELRVGGRITFDDGEGTVYHGEIRELEPHSVFSFTEADDLIHIELRPLDRSCLLIFTHTFDDPSIAESNEIGWRECFRELENVLRS